MKINVRTIVIMALAIALNFCGSTLALLLKLPIYLDTIGTILMAALFGPVYGIITGLSTALLAGVTTDIFSLYYAPVQLVTGLVAGLLLTKQITFKKLPWLPLQALVISLPGTIVSSIITVMLFGGITSAGSSIIVQFLRGLGMETWVAVTTVQFGSDFLDRFIALTAVSAFLLALPKTSRLFHATNKL